jgi:O-antigen/teichoic acid export membrane protein
MGIPIYGVREIAKVRDDTQKTSNVFWEILSINTVSTTAMILIYYTSVIFIDAFESYRILLHVTGITILLNYFNVDWFYTGVEEYKYITKRNVLIKLISLMGILLFVRDKDDYVLYALIYCLGIGGNNLFNLVNIRRYIIFSLRNLNRRRHIKSVLILLFSTIAVQLYTQLDTTMTGIICGDIYVGYYTNVNKLIRVVVSVVSAVGAIMLPRLSFYYEEGKLIAFHDYINKALKVILFLAVPAFIGLVLFADDIVMLMLGNDFFPSIITLKILAILIPILSVGNLFGTQILMVLNKEKKLMESVIFGSIINIVLNSVLILRFQQNGAALASVIAELIVMLIQIYFCYHDITIEFSKNYIISIVLSSTLMISGIVLYKSFTINQYFELITGIILGSFIYLVSSMVLKNEVALYIFRRIGGIVKIKI